KKITGTGALAGMIVGAVTAFIWGSTALSGYLYEIVPGFILNLIVAYIVSILTFKPNKEIEDEFDKTLEILNKN
ncbi:sodium:proline symporter, partial [Pseudoalteromonas sp. 2103]|nr:sodium:proline symporter [Pseudoalteromonas sp. 2103]